MIEQVVIGVCGISSIILTNMHRANWRRWALVIGMFAQPFWIYATWKAEQWGIFALSFAYAYGWAMGFYNMWIRHDRAVR